MSIALSQKTALVTGSSRGIGRGIAFKLAEHGVKKIAINYNENEPAAQDALHKVRDYGADGFVIKADVGKVEDVKRMFAEVKAEFGSLDIYVSNARATLATGFYQTPMDPAGI
jgi:enoyl-[acyl-carrier protein] reductase III